MGTGGGAGEAVTLYAVPGVRGGVSCPPSYSLFNGIALSIFFPPPPPQKGRKNWRGLCRGPQNDCRGGEIKRTDGERRVKGRGVVVAFLNLWSWHTSTETGSPEQSPHTLAHTPYATRTSLLSGYICIRPGRRSSFRLPVGRHVEEVPDKDSVIVGTADDLELVELEPEHSARMFH